MTIKTRSAETKAETKPARKVLSRRTKAAVEAASDAVPVVPASQPGVAVESLDQPVTGRGVFAVRTLGTAVSVEAPFLAEDGKVLRLPASFPIGNTLCLRSMSYAR